jgi:hypothetical protein
MKYIIFGAGKNAMPLISQLEGQGHEIITITDNDPNKWGSFVGDYKVISPEQIPEVDGLTSKIIISVGSIRIYEEIATQLTERGFVAGRDFNKDLVSIIGDIPGRVSGEIELPSGFKACKSFDEASQLALMQDGKRIFRMVFGGNEEKYLQVLERCKTAGLLGEWVVRTERIENEWKLPCALLLEHQYIEPITYCYEWTPKMFEQYVLYMLSFMEKLNAASLSLADGHHLNATVHDGHFLFLDFGAIATGFMQSDVAIEFLDCHFIPLVLMKRGQINKGYACLKNSGIRYSLEDVQGYLRTDEIHDFMALISCALRINHKEDVSVFLQKCRAFLEHFKDYTLVTSWDGYQDDEWKLSEKKESWTAKMSNVMKWIEEIQPNTILDVAGNMGWYGSYYHDRIQYSIIMDMDENCLDFVWHQASCGDYKNVVPVYMSFCTPSLSYYRDMPIDESLGVMPWIGGARRRLRTDLVLALAIVHHLAFRWQMTFDEIVKQLKAFSQKYVIVEFVDKQDVYLSDFRTERFDWYTKDNFEKALRRNFEIVDCAPSIPAESRTLYLCKKP